MAIERYGSKTDAVVKLVLVGFVCLLSFSIGTFVGKKFSDNQHRLAKFEPGHGAHDETRGVASIPDASRGKNATLTDDEIAQLAEEFVSDDESPGDVKAEAKPEVKSEEKAAPKVAEAAPKAADVSAKAPPVPAAAKKPTEEPLKVAKAIATDKAVAPPAVDPGKSRIPSSLPRNLASSPIGKFTVQVGAYPTEDEATKQTERLKKQGHSAFFVEAKVKNGDKTQTWYRVSVGLFATKKEAETRLTELVNAKTVSTALVQQITK